MPRLPSPKNIIVTIDSGTIVKAILFGLLVAGALFFWNLVLIILTAVVIASAVEPGTKALTRYKVPRTLAVVIIYVGVVAFLAGVFSLFIPPVLNEASGFLQTLPEKLDTSVLFGSLQEKSPSIFQPGLEELSQNLSLEEGVRNLQQLVSGAGGGFLRVVSAVFGGLMSFILILVLSFYLAVQPDGVAKFLHIVTPIKYEDHIMDLWRRSQDKIGRWMQGQLVLAVLIGVLVYLGLSILGVRYALLLALLAAVFEIIPIFGPILAAIPAVLVAFLDGGAASALLVVGLYIIIQQFENQLIYPLVVRKVVGIPPLLVIVAIIVGAQLGGFLGIILSVPIAAVFREYVSDIERSKSVKQEKLSPPV